MPSQSRFRLIDLFALMFVAAVCLGCLLPLIPPAHTTSRRTSCTNNQRQIAYGLISREQRCGALPGWRNNQQPGTVGGTATGWVFPITPMIDRNDIYMCYYQRAQIPSEHLKTLVCPQDDEAINNGTSTSYVINTGLPDAARPPAGFTPDHRANGVFHDRYDLREPAMMMGYIRAHDGTAQTLMLTENIDALTWTGEDPQAPGRGVREEYVGFGWYSTDRPADWMRINARTGQGRGQFNRPSSHHGGGVVATFCDHHVAFLNEDIDWQVYCQLLTPWGKAAALPGSYQPAQFRDATLKPGAY